MNNNHKSELEIMNFIEDRAMVFLPEDTIEAEIITTLYVNGEIIKVSHILTNKDVRKAFQDADNYYVEPDDIFSLTDKFKNSIKTEDGKSDFKRADK